MNKREILKKDVEALMGAAPPQIVVVPNLVTFDRSDVIRIFVSYIDTLSSAEVIKHFAAIQKNHNLVI